MSSSALPGTPRTLAARKTSLSVRLEDFPRTGSSGSPRGGSGTPVGGSRASSLRQGSLGMADSVPAVSPEIQAQLAAQAAEAASKAALEEIERDPIFSSFLDDEFNATSFASQVSLAESRFPRHTFTPPACFPPHFRKHVVGPFLSCSSNTDPGHHSPSSTRSDRTHACLRRSSAAVPPSSPYGS